MRGLTMTTAKTFDFLAVCAAFALVGAFVIGAS
jgi:hypothetical protein